MDNKLKKQIDEQALWALRDERYGDLAALADDLLKRKDEEFTWVGLFYRGLAHEFSEELVEAAAIYRKLYYEHRDSMPLVYLSRVLMAQGHYEKAIDELKLAANLRMTPEVALAMGMAFEGCKEYTLARKWFSRAAQAGKFRGFFGYSRISRIQGMKIRALCVDVLRVLLGPVIFLLIGKNASRGI